MAGRRPQNLERRQGVYYVRLHVPADLRRLLGRRELRWSLHTKDHRQAGRDALGSVVAFQSMCDRLRRMGQITEGELRQLLLDFHRNRSVAEPAPTITDAYERGYSYAQTEERIAGLEAIIEHDDYDALGDVTEGVAAETRFAAAAFAKQHGIDLENAPAGTRLMVLQGVARALVEEHRRFLHRLTDRLSPYEPQDKFFARQHDSPTSIAPTGISLDDALKAYENAKAGVHWKPRTVLEHKRVLRWAREFFGPTTVLAAVTQDDIRNFRDALLTLRKKGAGDAAFKSLAGAKPAQAISRKTAWKYFSFVSAAFNWLASEGHIDKSPVGNISVAVPKSKKGNGRIPFGQKEFKALFSSPMYVGSASRLRRMTPGPQLIKDPYYWVPLIGALSGMRLGEIVQLGLEDVRLDGIAHFIIRADEATGATVKSDAGWRIVPIHHRLIELGFVEFVAARQSKKASPRLFHEIRYGSDGSPSGEYSRWFGRRLDDIGLKSPGLVFHSFRGSFIGALTELGAPAYIIKAIVGHDQSDDITFGYSGHEGVSLAAKKEWVDKVAYLDALP